MSFEQDHVDALRQIQDAGGVPVVFRKENLAATYDPIQDRFSASATINVAGWAVEVKGTEAEMAFEPSDLVITQRVVLLFVPDVFGQLPETGSRVVWSDTGLTVAARFPLRPGGDAILARILVGR